jgi:hypothetical protein
LITIHRTTRHGSEGIHEIIQYIHDYPNNGRHFMKWFIAVTIICMALSSSADAETGWELVLSDTRIREIAAGGNSLWVGINADFNPTVDVKGRLVRIDTADNSEHVVVNRIDDYRVYALAVAEGGDVWMSAFPDGFMHLTIEAGEIADARTYTLDDGLLSDMPTGIATGPGGAVWVGGGGTGLVTLDTETDRFVPVERFAEAYVYDLLVDSNGRLWVAGSDGVSHFADDVWETFGTADGLASTHVYSLATGPGGDIWAGSYEEVVSCLSDGTWTAYGSADDAAIDLYYQTAEAQSIVSYQISRLEDTYHNSLNSYVPFAYGEDCMSIGFAQPRNARYTYAFEDGIIKAREIVDMNGDGDTEDGLTLSMTGEKGTLPGSSFGWYEGDPPPPSLSSFEVDADGMVWCKINRGGIRCFDGAVWSDATPPPGVTGTMVSADDGSLWCATDSGLYRRAIATSVADDVNPVGMALAVTVNPNPFNAATTIAFSLNTPSDVTVTVYNTLGQSVRRLMENRLPAGSHTVRWEGVDDHSIRVSTGVYFVRVEAGNARHTKRVTFMK